MPASAVAAGCRRLSRPGRRVGRAVVRNYGPDAEVERHRAFPRSDVDPVWVRRVDCEGADGKRVGGGGRRIEVKGFHQRAPGLAGVVGAPHPAVGGADINARTARGHCNGRRAPAGRRLDPTLSLA